MPVTDLDTTSWDALESSLALRLGRLGDHEFVVIAEEAPTAEPTPKRGLLGRLFGRDAPVDAGAFVQATRTESLLYAECVGSQSFGGRHAWTPAQELALASIGWVHRPALIGEEVYVMGAGADPDLNGHVPVGHAPAVAAVMVAAMRDVVGVAHPGRLEITLG